MLLVDVYMKFKVRSQIIIIGIKFEEGENQLVFPNPDITWLPKSVFTKSIIGSLSFY